MKAIIPLLIISLLILAACTVEESNPPAPISNDEESQVQEIKVEEEIKEEEVEEETTQEVKEELQEGEEIEQTKEEITSWKTATLQNVLTDTEFKIDNFKEKPVLIESFAIWCPTCKKQQKNIKELHEELGDSFVSIALDTDPNEDAQAVKEYAQSNGFDGYYVVSPPEVTKLLIDEFGTTVVNAPSAPVILLCPDGSAELLQRGLKSVASLKASVEAC